MFKGTNHREPHQCNEPGYRKTLRTASSLNPLAVILAFPQERGTQEGAVPSGPAADPWHAHDLVTMVGRTAGPAPFPAQSHTAAGSRRERRRGLGNQRRQDTRLEGKSFHSPVFRMSFLKSPEAQPSSDLVASLDVFMSVRFTLSLHQAHQMWRNTQPTSFSRCFKARELKPS